MRPVTTAATGVVSPETILTFEQNGDVFFASYRGGSIVQGFIVGRIKSQAVRFTYAQTDIQGHLDAGESSGTIEQLPDGRLRLTETFQWLTRKESGTNVFEELPRIA
jgi:hypothetical protein